ncbi:hypothetical protein [Paracoccus sp. KR1-242]|uniref:hypothetical protein n=1 Tax=Paracoccus sp. KR1-242 TaxID=3410028 RepID=UPI003BFFE56B
MEGDPNLWRSIAGARSPEVWIALFAGVLYVYRKSPHQSRVSRVIEAGISGMIGYSIGPDAAAWAGANEAFAVILLSSLGYLGLDVLTSVVADRAVLREIIIRRLGGGKNG